MLGILTNDHYAAFSSDNLALLADLFNGRLNFHCILPFLSIRLTIDAYLARQVIRPFVRS